MTALERLTAERFQPTRFGESLIGDIVDRAEQNRRLKDAEEYLERMTQ